MDDPASTQHKVSICAKDIRRGDNLQLRDKDSEVTSIKVCSRAGKVGGKNENWWNVINLSTNHMKPMNMEEATEIEKLLADDNNTEDIETFVVNIPRYRHGEQSCVEAKQVELEKFDEFDAYEEIKDEGQDRLGTNWVLVEKIKNGKNIIKARLTVRGDQEDTEGVRTDSPTVRKGNIKIHLLTSAKYGWPIKSVDVMNAFLQSVPLERDVFVLPPKERRIPGVLWRLKKPVYGLADACRGFHLSLSGEIQMLGCTKSLLDPAMHLFFPEGTTKDDEVKEPHGIMVSHVDDLLTAGKDDFEKKVMIPLKQKLKFGSEEEENFRYVGLNMKQTNDGIEVDQDHYVEALEVLDMKEANNLKVDELLLTAGQSEFRSVVGKLSMIAYQSRPDLCFEIKVLSTKFGKATKKDLKIAVKKMLKLKTGSTKMVFPDLGPLEEWAIVGHGDAGIKSMPDKLTSVGGHVVMLTNRKTEKTCVVSWKSKKIKRKVISSLAGEALAMSGTFGEIVYVRSILAEIFGSRVMKIPSVVFTDCNNLYEAVLSTKLVEDPWLVPDIAVIKQALEDKVISEIRLVPGELMIANCLTKQGASGDSLLEVLRNGSYGMPGGWTEI